MERGAGRYTVVEELSNVSDWLDADVVELAPGEESHRDVVLCKGGEPFRILRAPRSFGSPFFDVVIWNGRVCIGSGEWVFFVELPGCAVTAYRVEMYFGYFHVWKGRLYVASGTRVYCFDRSRWPRWQSEPLAVDGILFGEAVGAAMPLRCEMDPPGGWVDRCIDLDTGAEILGGVAGTQWTFQTEDTP